MKKCFNLMLQISTDIDEDRYYPTMVSYMYIYDNKVTNTT